MDDKKKIDIPDDPTEHGDEFLADPTGLTGVTQSNQDIPDNASDAEKMSDETFEESLDKASDFGERSENNLKPLTDTDDQIDIDGAGTNSPESVGEYDESGSAPDPDSDDDVTEAAQDMGIGLDADPEHPKELNIADDIDKAEEYQHTH